MNNMKEQVSGVVTGVGDQFNGSVKVNGVWYSNKKGFKNPAKVGDQVTLELSPWEFKDKKGLNITGVSVKEKPVEAPKAAEPKQEVKAQPSSGTRDFDAENRGKVRHGLTVALVSLVAQDALEVSMLKTIVNELTEFVMTGK